MKNYPRITQMLIKRNLLNQGEYVTFAMRNRNPLPKKLIVTNQRVFLFHGRKELVALSLQQLTVVNVRNIAFGAELELVEHATHVILENLPTRRAIRAMNAINEVKKGVIVTNSLNQSVSQNLPPKFEENKSKKIIYCGKCGYENQISSNFCASCGNSMNI